MRLLRWALVNLTGILPENKMWTHRELSISGALAQRKTPEHIHPEERPCRDYSRKVVICKPKGDLKRSQTC